MYRGSRIAALLTTAILFYPAILSAQYTLVLKNGRRITVQTYREEGQTLKIYGIGGEIGIPRAEVQSILKAGEASRGFDLRGSEGMEGEVGRPAGQEPGPGRSETKPPAEGTSDPTAKEEEEYRRRVEEVTTQLKIVRDQYLTATRGNSSPDPMLLETDEAIRGRNNDLSSRLKDLQHNPGVPSDAGPVKLSVPSPFTGQPPTTTEMPPGEGLNPAGIPIHTPPMRQLEVQPPPPAYSDREKDLSDLRSRMNQLVKEREILIEEMKQKNFETGNLFFE